VTELTVQNFVPILTWVFLIMSKPLPLIVKTVPPFKLPDDGLNDLTAAIPNITTLEDG
jgi:hypothetical protein